MAKEGVYTVTYMFFKSGVGAVLLLATEPLEPRRVMSEWYITLRGKCWSEWSCSRRGRTHDGLVLARGNRRWFA